MPRKSEQLSKAQELADMLGMPRPQGPQRKKRQAKAPAQEAQPQAQAPKSPADLKASMDAQQGAQPDAVLQDWVRQNMVYAQPGQWGTPAPGMIPANAFGQQMVAGLPQGQVPIGVPSGSVTPQVREAALAAQPAPEQISAEALQQVYLPLLNSAFGKAITAPEDVGAGGGGIPLSSLPPELLQAAGAQAEMIPRMYLDPQQLTPQELAALMALKGGG